MVTGVPARAAPAALMIRTRLGGGGSRPRRLVAGSARLRVQKAVGTPALDTLASALAPVRRTWICARPLQRWTTRAPVDVPRLSQSVPSPATAKRTAFAA